jgi:aminotransferase
MRMYEAERVQRVIPSGIRVFFDKAAELAARGADVVDFTIGRPDFLTPVNICEAAKKALDTGQIHYTPNAGLPELREAIARKALRDRVGPYDPGTEVIVTVGACEALAVALSAFVGPEDEVLVPSPHWPVYVNLILMNQGRPVFIPLRFENGFQLQASDVRAALTPKTKVLMLNNPHNPTGAVTGAENLRTLAEIALDRDLLIIADEVYEKILYKDASFAPVPSLKGMRERTVYINACSKTYSMTGWRIGWICAPKPLASSMLKIHQQLVTCPSSFAQVGAIEGLEGPQTSVVNMVSEFERRREVLVTEISQIPKLRMVSPQGSFYSLIDIRGLGLGSSEQVSLMMLEGAHVAVVPGSAFGEHGEGFVRLSFCCSTQRLREGVRRIRHWIEKSTRD